MGIKITTKFDNLINMPKNISKNFSREIKGGIEDEIISEILQGKSPVLKEYNFVEYSDSYSLIKGFKKPVDMNVTGKMLDSLYVKQPSGSGGAIEIGFKDEKAEYHQYGNPEKAKSTGNPKLPQRKLLPVDKGDKFNTKLTKFINKALKKAVKKAIK
jgi:hypothetical protein